MGTFEINETGLVIDGEYLPDKPIIFAEGPTDD